MSTEMPTPKRVLVAEDETLIRLDIVETLVAAGFDVVGEASNGEEAVKLALELEPDLCVMDVKMPKMDGITAAEHITEQSTNNDEIERDGSTCRRRSHAM